MVNTSKILTVSYGTFSCTLEGFDDSFDTMKAIAEYFRDLAADDRYFGAEPPSPDAEMLARIAEREVARQVQAHQDPGGIVLRAAAAPTLATPAAMSDAVADQPADSAAFPAQDQQPAADAPAAQTVPGESAFQQPAISDPVDTPAAGAPIEDAVAETSVEADETLVAEPAEDVVADAVDTDAIGLDDDVSEEDHIETAEEFFQNSPSPDALTVYESEGVEELTDDPDSIAAKLTRIRSVVLQSDLPDEQDDYSEDEHAQDFLNETAAELGAALAVDDAAEMNGADIAADEIDTLEQQAGSDVAEAPIAQTQSADDVEDTLSQVLADSIPEDVNSQEGTEIISEDTANQQTSEAVDDAEPVAADTDASGHEEMPARLSARLRKGQGTDVDTGTTDEVVDDKPSGGGSEQTQPDASVAEEGVDNDLLLPPEQEEELLRELAAVEADLAPVDTDDEADEADQVPADADADADKDGNADDPVQAEAHENIAETDEPANPEPAHPPAAREHRRKLETGDGQTDIARIFDEADSQLEQPESNQRRSAIQHLRAAVAATRAEKKAGSDLEREVDDSPYRSDLASVVRPNRPSVEDIPRSERPAEARPAPLKLVAEQRIDTAQEPILPRRVSAAELADDPEITAEKSENSFSDYAREMGATRLPDLLEAAAAYMSDVEGRTQFSRPMLMHKLEEIEKENFSREDGLRSFGQLLRDGKIQKIKGGRFTVTDETEFRGDRRHAS